MPVDIDISKGFFNTEVIWPQSIECKGRYA